MSTMSLEAEKNALIRQILDVDDIAILKKIRSMLNHEEEQVRVVAEEATPYRTKTEILESLDEACKELKLNLENLSALDREDLCKKADCIFEMEGLQCEVSEQGMRNGQPQDYGNFWVAIFQLKSAGEVAERLSECIWHNGEDSENLITDFMKA